MYRKGRKGDAEVAKRSNKGTSISTQYFSYLSYASMCLKTHM